MLTFSDWASEMRSNRYHYATRFARELPVLFVQPDATGPASCATPSGTQGVEILHVAQHSARAQVDQISLALRERGILRPLFWVYNFRFIEVVRSIFSGGVVFHATEDYFSKEFMTLSDVDHRRLVGVLGRADAVIAVSQGVAENFRRQVCDPERVVVVENGCDFPFWNSVRQAMPPGGPPVAVYQGGISRKIDFGLVRELTEALPSWRFEFYGRVFAESAHAEWITVWERLLELPNVTYGGCLRPEVLRSHVSRATVGLIPFVSNDWIERRSFPLKAFEYAACGIPIVTTRIEALEQFRSSFRVACGVEEWVRELRAAAEDRGNQKITDGLVSLAAHQDYDKRFEIAVRQIEALIQRRKTRTSEAERLCILVLYDPNSAHVAAIRDHLEAFQRHSKHRYFFASATGRAVSGEAWRGFDVVIVHFSVRLSVRHRISPAVVSALERFPRLKVLMIQDEYERTDTACRWIERLGFQVIHTCVPPESVPVVYPFRGREAVEFHRVLTGYVPERLRRRRQPKGMAERRVHIGYRGRPLPDWYGSLGREKLIIGLRMKEECIARGVPSDIETGSEARIYGDAWFDFLEDCRATLGTESGSNIFDRDGRIEKAVNAWYAANPGGAWDRLYAEVLEREEGAVRMNQISPKVFEAIALGTALILFRGEYSGVLEADRHYIPLEKDFSNVAEVLARVEDLPFLVALTERARREIVSSGEFGYPRFVASIDQHIESLVPIAIERQLAALPGFCATEESESDLYPLVGGLFYSDGLPLSVPVGGKIRFPGRIQLFLGPIVARAAEAVSQSIPSWFKSKAKQVLPTRLYAFLRRKLLGLQEE